MWSDLANTTFKAAIIYKEPAPRPWFFNRPLRSSQIMKRRRKWQRKQGSPLIAYIDMETHSHVLPRP